MSKKLTPNHGIPPHMPRRRLTGPLRASHRQANSLQHRKDVKITLKTPDWEKPK